MKHITDFRLRPVIAMLLISLQPVALADSDHDEARRLLKSGDILSLEVILQKLQAHYPGKVLEVELEQKTGQIIYEVEILGQNGVVRELYVDAKTGDVLRSKVDD